MNIITERPRRNMLDFRGRDFENIFDGFVRPTRWVEQASSESLTPAMDIAEHEHDYVVRTDLPGVKKDDIDVNLENGLLTITAETRSEQDEKKQGRIIRSERHYGKYVRSLKLGSEINENAVKASYKDGVLELTLPKSEAAKPKKVSVDVG
ncbi:MAG: Hsp20/alpha crystallin family protein [Gammaproteobacteria bacterium]|nr:MAG: Hsp20/alpha crystallin family protein [Gammaproteobacteria bacterium]